MIKSTYIRFNRLVTAFIGGIPAGICVSVGGAAYLSTDNRYIGALLFSVGLLAIITYNFSLYTGKVGLSFGKDAFFILELAAMWVGNLAGTMLFTGLLRGTRVGAEISAKAAVLALSKTSAPLPELFCLGAGCGICMYIAVTWSGEDSHPTAWNAVLVTMPVAVFILSGYEHCIADMFYFLAAGALDAKAFAVLLTVTLGNTFGSLLMAGWRQILSNLRL